MRRKRKPEWIQRKHRVLCHCDLNFADLFTKPLVKDVFKRLVKLCTEDKHEHFRSIEVSSAGEEARIIDANRLQPSGTGIGA